MRRGPDPWCRLVLPHLIHAARGLDLVTGAPPGDEGTREGGISKIDRHRIRRRSRSPCANRDSTSAGNIGGLFVLDLRRELAVESVSQKSCARRSSSKKHSIKLGREKEDYKARAPQRLPTPGVPEIALKYGPGAAKTCKISLLEDPANDSWQDHWQLRFYAH